MDAFLEAYFAIDVDHSETITTSELTNYMLKNDMDPAFIERWQELFDPDNTGVITLEKFCDVLGLELANVRKKFDTVDNLPEYTEISADIDDEMKPKLIRFAAEGERLHPEDDKELVKWLKLTLDKSFGRLWHCMIVRGQYFSYYSYEPKHSFCFKMGKRIFIMFKTPAY
ncbi:unnamed protein product [Calicophoron daubneyi]|uniref:Tegument antigen n=1 Tax=Calicophoron daubneyi TaxID=300641 RepID=A0AAV2TRS4_CALDB